MRALGFEPKKEEIKKMISDIDKDGSGTMFVLPQVFFFSFCKKAGTKLGNFLLFFFSCPEHILNAFPAYTDNLFLFFVN
jgi:Ca2+-binding EF-hand superfamily protein